MRFIEGFLAPAVAQNWLVQLENSDWVEWQRETFSIFGRQVEAPRTLSWFGDAGLNYRYTGIDHCAVGWPEPLQRLKGQVEMTAGQSFNFCYLIDTRTDLNTWVGIAMMSRGVAATSPRLASVRHGALVLIRRFLSIGGFSKRNGKRLL